MQRLSVREDVLFDGRGGRCSEQDFEKRRCVDDDQCVCVSSRTASAGVVLVQHM
jgi:hypothetical protein